MREARLDDLADVIDLCGACERVAWTERMVAPNESRIVLVETLSGELAGVAKTHFHPETDDDAPAGHYLGGIIVAPDWRRRGI